MLATRVSASLLWALFLLRCVLSRAEEEEEELIVGELTTASFDKVLRTRPCACHWTDHTSLTSCAQPSCAPRAQLRLYRFRRAVVRALSQARW